MVLGKTEVKSTWDMGFLVSREPSSPKVTWSYSGNAWVLVMVIWHGHHDMKKVK